MKHVINIDDLNGYIISQDIASCREKSLSVAFTVGEIPLASYRVYDKNKRLHWDYDSYGDAVLAYNEL